MLKLSAKGDYGLMLIKQLALLPAGSFMPIREAASQTNMPFKYLERVALALAGAGIIVSKEGQGGGYALSRPTALISLVEVLSSLEGRVDPVVCTHDGKCCDRKNACERKTGWQTVHNKMYQVLSQYSVADILKTINQ